MTWAEHMTEIARQGIWASLTGGWYYEPKHSLFCNAVHLYLWILLFLLPLIVGLLSAGFSSAFFCIYIAFTFFVFIVIKLVVLYLHKLFDSSDPIVVLKPKDPLNLAREQRRMNARHIESRINDRFFEMIEMRRLETRTNADIRDTLDGFNTDRRRRGQRRLSAPGASLDGISIEDRMNPNVSVTADIHRGHTSILRELAEPHFLRRGDLTTPSTRSFAHVLERKLSEPILSDLHLCEEPGLSVGMLVTSSLCADLDKGSTHSLRNMRNSDWERGRTEVRKDGEEGEKQKEEEKAKDHVLKIEEIEVEVLDEPSSHEKNEKNEDDTSEDPLRTSQSEGVEGMNGIDVELGRPLARRIDSAGRSKDEEVSRIMNYPVDRCSFLDMIPLSQLPSTSRDFTFPSGGHLDSVDLTKFLEELIDRHPETLDALENLREKRRREETQPEEVRNAAIASLSALSQKEGTHVANDYADTTQGAVHSFQDEDGTWWTYAFDEQGIGTAQALGNSRQIMELLGAPVDEKDEIDDEMEELAKRIPERGDFPCTSSGTIRRMEPSLQVIPEAASSEDEEVADLSRPSESRRGTRFDRPSSSSSNESHTFLSAPINVFRAAATTPTTSIRRGGSRGSGSSRSRPRSNHMSLAARIRNAVRSEQEGTNVPAIVADPEEEREYVAMRARERERERRQRMQAAGTSTSTRRVRVARPPNPVAQFDQIVPPDATDVDRVALASRFLQGEISLGGMGVGPPMDTVMLPRKVSHTKKKYYYNLSIIPFAKDKFKLRMDRLSLAALFDRNRSAFTLLFDIFLAAAIATVSATVLASGIFHDVSLVLFAFVTASAHFSLLKSVQPDPSSPTHGFNWQVSYSRPFYFLALSILLLVISSFIPKDPMLLPWNWNIYRLSSTSMVSVLLAVRDLIASIIIFLPIIFTVGWMPQVSTLIHHVLEQVEMHILGGTASFGALSAAIQLFRSLFLVVILCTVSFFAHSLNHSTADALPAALLVALSFLQSRFSSNPHLWRLLFDSLKCTTAKSAASRVRAEGGSSVLCGSRVPLRDERGEANREGGGEEEEDEGDKDSDSTCTSPRCPLDEEGANGDIGAFPKAIKNAALERARRDILFSFVLFLVTFAVHCTSVLTATQPYITFGSIGATCLFGFFNHYLYVHLRKHTPWKILAHPVLKSDEFGLYEAARPAKLMIFEKIHMWMLIVEKNLLYPLTVVACLTASSHSLFFLSPFLLPAIAFRLLRSAMSHPQLLYIPLGLSFLVCFVDFRIGSPISLPKECTWQDLLPYVWYILAVLYPKWEELTLKLHFVLAYIAPWQITWGSAFHAFAQPFSVPHSVLIALQTILSSIISAPLNPFLGSSFITISYVRPVKFWERDYNTERSDASNTRLASQIDRGPMLDDSNLNAVFYEHLTRSLQIAIAGDMSLGRWGASIRPGDCFILASFYLNCLVHIVEVGNGFVTFQLRGLEFRGTYCHQREVEAISEDTSEGSGCCCCSPGSLPGILSLNTAWNLRWLAWEVTTGKLIVDGYSITDNSAINLLQVHELRRLLVTLYCRCIIYYAISSPKLHEWLQNETISSALEVIEKTPRYVDLDHMFCTANDEDFDTDLGGISRASFLRLYSTWIQYFCSKNSSIAKKEDAAPMGVLPSTSSTCSSSLTPLENRIHALCYALTLLGRRSLGAASYNRHSNAAESFLYGLHSLFKGDFRVTSSHDEWVFADMDLLKCVIAPSVRMALKLHQDHFTISDDLDDPKALYHIIRKHQAHMFISHEHDPEWRAAIMANTPSLLALRHMYDDGQDDYKIIMLNKMHLNMRVIKLNRECVRAFWSGQQQELVFLRNRNPERGSIQNARQVLRNMINSSADQPVGYPIYVSPLTTSFIDTHPQYAEIVGAPLTLQAVSDTFHSAWVRLRAHFGLAGSSGLGSGAAAAVQRAKRETAAAAQTQTLGEDVQMEHSVVQLTAEGARVTLVKDYKPIHLDNTSDSASSGSGRMVGPCTSSSSNQPQSSLFSDKELEICTLMVQIVSDDHIFRSLHEPMKCTGEPLVVWPKEEWRLSSATKAKNELKVTTYVGKKGVVVHTWYPNHAQKPLRSHIGETIHLVMLLDSYNLVPVAEKGLKKLPDMPEWLSMIREKMDKEQEEGRLSEGSYRLARSQLRAGVKERRDRHLGESASSPPPVNRQKREEVRGHRRRRSEGGQRVKDDDTTQPSTSTNNNNQ